MCNLWDKFRVIELTHNHRQAEDWEYAELLNRIRWNEQTEEDLMTLATRISDANPDDAIYVYAKNDACRDHNDAKLESLPGEEYNFIATHPKGKQFAKIDPETGKVGQTAFVDNLCLKVGDPQSLPLLYRRSEHG